MNTNYECAQVEPNCSSQNDKTKGGEAIGKVRCRRSAYDISCYRHGVGDAAGNGSGQERSLSHSDTLRFDIAGRVFAVMHHLQKWHCSDKET